MSEEIADLTHLDVWQPHLVEEVCRGHEVTGLVPASRLIVDSHPEIISLSLSSSRHISEPFLASSHIKSMYSSNVMVKALSSILDT